MRARVLQLHPMTAKKLGRLRNEAEVEGVYRVARRLHAVLLNHAGNTSGEIARLLDSPRSRVSEWLKNYEDYGYDGLLEGYRPGRPSTLTSAQKHALEDILESGPVAYDFTSGVWTSPMVARVVHEEFGVDYHPGHVRKLMHQLGFTVQRPTRKLTRADPQTQDRWHRHTYPNLKKSQSARRGADPLRRGNVSPGLYPTPHLGKTRLSARRASHRPAQKCQGIRVRRRACSSVPLPA